jgi:hypothetical protein
MDTIVSDLVLKRFKLGRERYSHGLLHSSNDNMNFRTELVEELLDAVVYAAADVVRSIPVVSTNLNIKDDGTVKLVLTVNHDIYHDDGESAIHAKIVEGMTNSYDYKQPSDKEHVMLLCIFTLCGVLKLGDCK